MSVAAPLSTSYTLKKNTTTNPNSPTQYISRFHLAAVITNDLHHDWRMGVAQEQGAGRAQQEGPGSPAGRRHDGAVPARSGACRPRDERARRQAGGARRAGHALPRRRDIRSDRREQARPRGQRLRSAQRAVRPPGRFGAGLRAGRGVGREGGEKGGKTRGRGGERARGQTQIDRNDRPCPWRPQPSRAHLFLCVRGPYYEYNGRGYAVLPGVDIRCHAC